GSASRTCFARAACNCGGLCTNCGTCGGGGIRSARPEPSHGTSWLARCRPSIALVELFGVEKAAFDGLEAAHTPAGGDHLVDQGFFGGGGGLVDFHLVVVYRPEVVIGFAFEDAVFGPRDLAPLARAVSDFSCVTIRASPDPSLFPRLWLLR